MKKLITLLVLIPSLCIGQWNQLGSDISGNMANDEFGISVALNGNGDTFISSTQSANNSTGQVGVFQWDGSAWAQKGTFINGANPGEQFGSSVDISDDGNTILIGAPEAGVDGAPGYSAVYEWNGSNWLQKGANIIGENELLNSAGEAVSISSNGSIVAIGAIGNSNSNGDFTGHVRVYQWNGSTWVQLGNDIDGANDFNAFGSSVSLNSDGILLSVGATGAGIGGEVSVYEWNGTNWIQLGATLSGGLSNNFGSTNDLDSAGTTLSVGALSNDNDFGSGYIEVYSWDGTNWNQKGNRLETDPNGDDFFQKAKLNEDGNTIVTGGYGANEGFVEVHTFDGTNWSLIDARIVGETNGDFFGFAVDISNDGSRVVIGAPENEDNGEQSGEVKVFENLSILSTIDLTVLNEVKTFPNPFNNYVNTISETEIESYSLFSMDGTRIQSENINNEKELKINTSNLSSGIYILNIQGNRRTKNIKLIKK